jgi:hypothetical protein
MKTKAWKLSRAHILLVDTLTQKHKQELNQAVGALVGYQKENTMRLLNSFRDDLKIPVDTKVGFDGTQFTLIDEEVNG